MNGLSEENPKMYSQVIKHVRKFVISLSLSLSRTKAQVKCVRWRRWVGEGARQRGGRGPTRGAF